MTDLRPFAAETCVVGGIAANLIIPFLTRRPNMLCAIATLCTLLLALAALVMIGDGPSITGTHLSGLLLFDSTALIWKATLLLFVAGVVSLWIGHTGRTLRQGDAPEFFVLLLGSTLGMCLMGSTTHLLMIVMSIAMASLPSYLLAGFAKQNRRASEASLKYVLFGAVTGAIMVYGISFLYGLCGTLRLDQLTGILPSGGAAVLAVTVAGLIIGIGFKISAVPLHFWCPDVFEGATIEVTTFLSVASKGAALVLLLRIVQAMDLRAFAQVIGLLGALTATVGNTAAFTQNNIKRLLAYSSIAQAGYMMCVISAADHGSSIGWISQPLLIYLIIYAVTNLGAFAVTAVVIRHNGGEGLDHFAGLGRSSPLLAGSFFCCLISLIGLPPFGGFAAKVNILWALAKTGSFGGVLVVVIVLNTVLSAFYYFRVIRTMYLQASGDRSRNRRLWTRDPLGVLISSICAGMLVLLFFGFGVLYWVTSPKLIVPPGDPANPNPTAPTASAIEIFD